MPGSKARQTRAHFIENARALILENGIDPLSMDRLAERAGYSKGACMYHFPTKRALQRALVEDYVEHLQSQLERHESKYAVHNERTFIQAYIDWFDDFEHYTYEWARIGVALLSQTLNDPEVMKPLRDWYKQLYARIEDLPEDKRADTFLAIMALEGFFYTRKFGVYCEDEAVKNAALKKLRDMWTDPE